jgi:predicted ferric reductase
MTTTLTRPPGWRPQYGRWHRQWRARRGDLLEGLAVSSVVVVVVAFLARGGIAHLGTTATMLIAAGQLLGLVATDLLLIQMLLAARLPWVDRVYGLDRALKAHRVLGRVTLPMLLMHAMTLTAGYAAQDGLSARSGWIVEPWRMLHGAVPDMVTATISILLMTLVAVTSIRAARNKMGYERWHLIHLTAYAAVLVSLPHQLSTGSDIARHPVERAYWLGLYVFTATCLLWWRFLVPIARSIWHAPYVEAVVPESPGVWSVWVRGRRLDRMGAQAGQYFTWRFLARGMLLAGHPWSLSAAPDRNRLRITVRELGDHSSRLPDLRPGTRVLLEGPYGAFTADRRVRRRVTLLAAGIGITPVRALAEELTAEHNSRPGEITLIYRADSDQQLALAGELAELARDTGLVLRLLVGPPVNGSWLPRDISAGRSDGVALASIVRDIDLQDVYVCGPQRWMDLVHLSLAQAGVPRRQIHDERFVW